MTCYHPKKLFKLCYDGEKCITKFAPYDAVAYTCDYGHKQFFNENAYKDLNLNEYQLVDSATVTPDYNFVRSLKPRLYINPFLIPCGKCIGCRQKQSLDWATRIYFESLEHEKNCFITLTYKEEYLPLSTYVDKEGEIKPSMTLVRKHFVDFMKRLRYYLPETKIRYFGCGEYGGRTKRPHYHAIIFGEDFTDDRVYKGKSKSGFGMYDSPTLQKAWKFGFTTVMDFSTETALYVAKYVNKKALGFGSNYCRYYNVEPEFSNMSRMPGIGKKYFEDNKDKIYEHQKLYIATKAGAFEVMPPRYYDQLYDCEEPVKSEKIKLDRRKIAEDTLSEILRREDKPYLEYLKAKEREALDKLQKEKGDRV